MACTRNGESIYPEKIPEIKLGITTSYHITEFEKFILIKEAD